jgi:hypothetical protein
MSGENDYEKSTGKNGRSSLDLYRKATFADKI